MRTTAFEVAVRRAIDAAWRRYAQRDLELERRLTGNPEPITDAEIAEREKLLEALSIQEFMDLVSQHEAEGDDHA